MLNNKKTKTFCSADFKILDGFKFEGYNFGSASFVGNGSAIDSCEFIAGVGISCGKSSGSGFYDFSKGICYGEGEGNCYGEKGCIGLCTRENGACSGWSIVSYNENE